VVRFKSFFSYSWFTQVDLTAWLAACISSTLVRSRDETEQFWSLRFCPWEF